MRNKSYGLSINDIIITMFINDGIIPVASYEEFDYSVGFLKKEAIIQAMIIGVDNAGEELKFKTVFKQKEFNAFMNNLSYNIVINDKEIIVRK